MHYNSSAINFSIRHNNSHDLEEGSSEPPEVEPPPAKFHTKSMQAIQSPIIGHSPSAGN